MGGRAQERVEHIFLFFDARRLWMVRAKTALGPICAPDDLFRLRPDVEADVGHRSIRSVAA